MNERGRYNGRRRHNFCGNRDYIDDYIAWRNSASTKTRDIRNSMLRFNIFKPFEEIFSIELIWTVLFIIIFDVLLFFPDWLLFSIKHYDHFIIFPFKQSITIAIEISYGIYCLLLIILLIPSIYLFSPLYLAFGIDRRMRHNQTTDVFTV